MLKGKTIIELTDVNTGEKEIHEDENMVTNAMSNIFQSTFGHLTTEATLRGYIPAYATLMGGLLMFDQPIEENPNILYAPAGVLQTACGRYNTTNTSTGTHLGTYNVNESIYDSADRIMKFVYDYATSQGNGTIASVCLTSQEAGYGPYGGDEQYAVSVARQVHAVPKSWLVDGKDMYSGITLGSYYHLFLLDPENDVGYYFSLRNSTTLSIQKRQLGLKTFSLFSTAMPILETIELPALERAIGSYTTYCFDRDDNALYIFSAAAATVASNGSFLITKVDLDTLGVAQYPMTNTTATTMNTSGRYAFVHRGMVYVRSNTSSYRYYKMELGNSANVVQMTGNSGSYLLTPVFASQGKVYWQYVNSSSSTITSYAYTTDEELNVLKKGGNDRFYYYAYSSKIRYIPAFTPVLGHEMFYYLTVGNSYNLGIYFMSHYLATINNLTEPVVKTSDKTMKVTYIIQEQ